MDAAARQAVKQMGGEAEIECDDILRSMASCLIEDNTAVFHVEALPDAEPPSFEASKKPPKEIFYRKTQLFTTAIPAAVGPKRCTSQYLCTGAPATIKCLSCVMYDPKNLGFFCKACFDSRHPWYRVPHIFEDINKDESVAHTLKVSHRRAEMHRFTEEGKDEYESLMKNQPKLDYIADDDRVANNLKDAGFRSMALEKRMRDFRRNIRKDILSKPLERDHELYEGGRYKLEMTEDEAATLVARSYRGFKTRHMLSSFVKARVLRGFDFKSNREFFYDKITKKSSWRKPVLLMRTHANSLPVKSAADDKSSSSSTSPSKSPKK